MDVKAKSLPYICSPAADQPINGNVISVSSSTTTHSQTSPLGASAMVNLAKMASSCSSSNMQVINTTSRPRTTQSFKPSTQLRPIQGATIALPAGLNLPPGTVLMQNEKGQLVIVSKPAQVLQQHKLSNINQQSQQRPNTAATAILPSVSGQIIVASSPNRIPALAAHPQAPCLLQTQKEVTTRLNTVSNASTSPSQTCGSTKVSATIAEDIRKCKNFLETLLRLSSQQPPETYGNVKKLIQGLLDSSIAPETFTERLQRELKSQKQPGLAPFLKKSLPDLRNAVRDKQLSITGLSNDWLQTIKEKESVKSMSTLPLPPLPTVTTKTPMKRKLNHTTNFLSSSPSACRPTQPVLSSVSSSHLDRSSASPTLLNSQVMPKNINKGHTSCNDRQSGNSFNPHKSQAVVPTCQEIGNTLLHLPALHLQLNSMLFRKGMRQMSSDVLKLLSDSCQERLHHLITESIIAAGHRLEIYKTNPQYQPSVDIRSKIKFLESLERLEKKRKDEIEREALLRVAKSRTKTEDPEQVKLKQKAKEMQQAELEVARQRDANLTALAAIGPRKRKQLDLSTYSPASSSHHSIVDTQIFEDNQAQAPTRTRLKRINLRDIQYVTEQDKNLTKSLTLYKSHVR